MKTECFRAEIYNQREREGKLKLSEEVNDIRRRKGRDGAKVRVRK